MLLKEVIEYNKNKKKMKNMNINPIGLKGNQVKERIIELMGKTTLNESASRYSIELTKIGPDGKSYAIVRENQTYFIKSSPKTSELMLEDFKYMGGLQNKKSEAYSTYAKAIKHLNINFKSLAEAYGVGGDINVFVDDNLLSETPLAAGFSSSSGNGFSGQGNLDGNGDMNEEEIEEEVIEEEIEEEELTEAEKAVDRMLEANYGEEVADKEVADEEVISESRLSIALSIETLDDVLNALKKKVV